jgi:CrcB protein
VVSEHRPLHLRPAAVAQVAIGGVFGAAAREALEQAIPTAKDSLPWATLLINLSGALVLGLLLEALVRAGDDPAGDDRGGRRRARLVLGTGFLGAFTTYSTFALEVDLLVRAGRPLTAAAYAVVTVAGGLVAAGIGVRVGALRSGRGPIPLPRDPDADGAP